jgi:hypothetical protein
MADEEAHATMGQALGWLTQAIALSATYRSMELLQVPGGRAKWEAANKAMVTALHSFGRLISAALSANPDGSALAVEDAPEWLALKEEVAAISRAVNDTCAET